MPNAEHMKVSWMTKLLDWINELRSKSISVNQIEEIKASLVLCTQKNRMYSIMYD